MNLPPNTGADMNAATELAHCTLRALEWAVAAVKAEQPEAWDNANEAARLLMAAQWWSLNGC